jgi:NAD(P)-dependent dehydrogenase (short-subunit alcohol dehydrogenase family)
LTRPINLIAEQAVRLLSLAGKVALVTGAGSGIGRGISLRLAEMGAAVALVDIDEIKGRETAAEIRERNGEAAFLLADVARTEDCRRAISSTVDRQGKVDILCNCAGIAIRKSVLDLTEQEWDRTLDVALKGVFLLSREVIPHMIRAGGGSIINIGSGWSLKGGPRAAAYCAAKSGVLNLTRAMAIDHGKHNLRINCVCPGDVDTPMLRSECAQLGDDVETFMQEAANRPLGRVGSLEDIANAVLFLASPMSTWITGAALVVDGGGLA